MTDLRITFSLLPIKSFVVSFVVYENKPEFADRSHENLTFAKIIIPIVVLKKSLYRNFFWGERVGQFQLREIKIKCSTRYFYIIVDRKARFKLIANSILQFWSKGDPITKEPSATNCNPKFKGALLSEDA